MSSIHHTQEQLAGAGSHVICWLVLERLVLESLALCWQRHQPHAEQSIRPAYLSRGVWSHVLGQQAILGWVAGTDSSRLVIIVRVLAGGGCVVSSRNVVMCEEVVVEWQGHVSSCVCACVCVPVKPTRGNSTFR